MTPNDAVLNKDAVPFKIATLSIASLLSFFSEEKKSIQKGENHYKSDHIEAFSYQQGILRGVIAGVIAVILSHKTYSYCYQFILLSNGTFSEIFGLLSASLDILAFEKNQA